MAQTQTQTQQLPSYIEQPIKTSLGGIQDWLNSDANYVYGSKKGESLFTPLSAGQNKAIGNAHWLADQDLAKMFGVEDATGLWGQVGSASYDKSRLVDENGALGAMSDYMNPYISGVLDPQIREIEEALQRGRRDLGANRAMSGSFGDARHGVAEGEIYRGANEAISDATGRAYADAFDRAMGFRGADINRIVNTQMAETGNKASAAQGLASEGNRYFDLITDVNDTLFNAGKVERDAEQERSDAMRAFQEAIKNKKYDDALKLLGAAQGSPYSSTTTSQQKQTADPMGIFGSILSALFA
jgi:hypothetical protein